MAERFKTPDDAVQLGARMRAARKALGLTLTSLAKETGVDAGQLSKIERGQMVTASTNVQIACAFLQISVANENVPPTLAGRQLDKLVANLPNSDPAVARLVGAIQEMVLSLAAQPRSKTAD
jgi:transcriptional regulator with XRE-family HTH domain